MTDEKKTLREGLESAKRDALEKAKLHSSQQSEGASPMPNTPHGGEDIDKSAKPSPTADSDDEAPFQTFQKIDPHDREHGAHRGPERAEGHASQAPAASDHGHGHDAHAHDAPGGNDAHGHGAHDPHAVALGHGHGHVQAQAQAQAHDEHGHPVKRTRIEKRAALLLAEYGSPGECLRAAEKLRDAGYTKFDTHTPFPVHGMDKAMGLRDSRLGWLVLALGLTGTTSGFAMMYWMNAIDYPIVIGGKPPTSFPSMIPIMFELTILFASLAAVFGMLGFNKLPRHNHPLFESERFGSFSNDKFFVSVETEDPKFNLGATRALLDNTHPEHVELVEDEVEVRL